MRLVQQYGHLQKQAEKQTERQTDRDARRQTDRGRQTETQAGRQTDRGRETELFKERERESYYTRIKTHLALLLLLLTDMSPITKTATLNAANKNTNNCGK